MASEGTRKVLKKGKSSESNPRDDGPISQKINKYLVGQKPKKCRRPNTFFVMKVIYGYC